MRTPASPAARATAITSGPAGNRPGGSAPARRRSRRRGGGTRPRRSPPSAFRPGRAARSAASSPRPSPIAISRRKRPSRMPGGIETHHAEVEEGHAAVVRQEDVAGVRVGVEEPVDDDLVQVRAEELVGQRGAVDVDGRQRIEVRDLAALHELHRQHAFGRVPLDRKRDDDVLEALQVLRQPDEVLGLPPVVELGDERAPEGLDGLLELVAVSQRRMAIHEAREVPEGLEVLGDPLADSGALDLHGDRPAVAHAGPVDLAERRRGEGLGLEGGKRPGDARSQLGFDDLLDLLERERLHAVLEPRKRLEVGSRQEVRAAREQLPELDEGRSRGSRGPGRARRGRTRPSRRRPARRAAGRGSARRPAARVRTSRTAERPRRSA